MKDTVEVIHFYKRVEVCKASFTCKQHGTTNFCLKKGEVGIKTASTNLQSLLA